MMIRRRLALGIYVPNLEPPFQRVLVALAAGVSGAGVAGYPVPRYRYEGFVGTAACGAFAVFFAHVTLAAFVPTCYSFRRRGKDGADHG